MARRPVRWLYWSACTFWLLRYALISFVVTRPLRCNVQEGRCEPQLQKLSCLPPRQWWWQEALLRASRDLPAREAKSTRVWHGANLLLRQEPADHAGSTGCGSWYAEQTGLLGTLPVITAAHQHQGRCVCGLFMAHDGVSCWESPSPRRGTWRRGCDFIKTRPPLAERQMAEDQCTGADDCCSNGWHHGRVMSPFLMPPHRTIT